MYEKVDFLHCVCIMQNTKGKERFMGEGYKHPATVHPSLLVAEWMEEKGVRLRELARRTGLPRQVTRDLVNGDAVITKEIARRIEKGTGIPADYLLRFQARYYRDVAAGLPELFFL